MIGYQEESVIREVVQRGQEVLIPKGVVVESTYPGREKKISGKMTKVVVHHTLPGRSVCKYEYEKYYKYLYPNAPKGEDKWGRVVYHISNPQVRWVGASGYWNGAEIKDIVVINS